MAALAVHQHQHLIGSQAAERGRARVVGAVRQRGAGEVERRRQHLQDLRRFRSPRELDVLAGEYVDRHRGIHDGAVGVAGADRGDLAQRHGRLLERRVARGRGAVGHVDGVAKHAVSDRAEAHLGAARGQEEAIVAAGVGGGTDQRCPDRDARTGERVAGAKVSDRAGQGPAAGLGRERREGQEC